MDPITILTALLPAATDGVRALINHFSGGAGAKPMNVDETVKLMEAQTAARDSDVKRLEALHTIDQVENVSQWVNNVRAMQRPVAVAVILATWVASCYITMPIELAQGISNMASSVVFYLFGERGYLKAKQMVNK